MGVSPDLYSSYTYASAPNGVFIPQNFTVKSSPLSTGASVMLRQRNVSVRFVVKVLVAIKYQYGSLSLVARLEALAAKPLLL